MKQEVRVTHMKVDYEKNPEYTRLMNWAGDLREKQNHVNNHVHDIIIPHIFVWRIKKKLNIVAKEIEVLQKEHNEWHNQTNIFFSSPTFLMNTGNDIWDSFLFSHINLKAMYTLLNHEVSMEVLAANIKFIREHYNNQVNFCLAMLFGVITFFGLIASVISIARAS